MALLDFAGLRLNGLLAPSEEIAEAIEVFLQNKTYSLRVKTVAGEISVVGLIVHAHGKIAVREQQIAQVEVADEARRGIGIITIAELSVEEQSVVEQSAAQYALILCVIPSLVARRDVGSEVPIRVIDNTAQHIVDLLADRSAE